MKKLICLFFLVMVMPSVLGQEKNQIKEFDTNFAHVVYIWLKNPDSESDRATFEASLNKFLKNSKFAKTNFVGTPPKAVRDVVDDSFTYNLIVTFESAEAQEGYQNEQPHLTFIEECKDLWKKVVVYDAMGLNNK